VQQCSLRNKVLCVEANGDDMHPRVDTLIMAMNAIPNPPETSTATSASSQNGPVLWTVRDVADYARCSTHPILPFCYFTLKASRTALRFRNLVHKGFILKPETLGQHLLSRRLLLKLTQKEVATRLSTLREHYERWERDEVEPTASFWPRLIDFLGYYPFPSPTPADWVLMARRLLGLSQFGFGRRVKAIAKDVREWEHGVSEPPPAMLAKIQQIATPLVGKSPM
jgi:DNA-binding transcriptional regulator YiaG